MILSPGISALSKGGGPLRVSAKVVGSSPLGISALYKGGGPLRSGAMVVGSHQKRTVIIHSPFFFTG
jgi:hypothetical protein